MTTNIPWPAERTKRLRELLAAGLGYRAIARELECSRSAVAGKAARLGLNREPATPSLDERLRWDRVTATGCRWVEGDPRTEWRWCGAPQKAGTAWCAQHLKRAYGTRPAAALEL
jgi:hypothetical protein